MPRRGSGGKSLRRLLPSNIMRVKVMRALSTPMASSPLLNSGDSTMICAVPFISQAKNWRRPGVLRMRCSSGESQP